MYYTRATESNRITQRHLNFSAGHQTEETPQLCQISDVCTIGTSVTKDLKKAAEFFQKAAQNGDTEGKFMLGLLYDNGEGLKQNKKRAIELYREAAMSGYMRAQANLASMYYAGEGIKADKEKGDA